MNWITKLYTRRPHMDLITLVEEGVEIKFRNGSTLTVEEEPLIRWAEGECLVQEAFPDMSITNRELLISGLSQADWDLLFGEDEPE